MKCFSETPATCLVTLNGSTTLTYESFAKNTLKINTGVVLIRIITTFINKTLLKI